MNVLPAAGSERGRFVAGGGAGERMGSMKKRFVAGVAAFLAAVAAWGQYPSVSGSGDVSVNRWTSQVSKAVAAARANDVPMLITFVNHGATGNCGHCATWVKRCVTNSSKFANFLEDHPLILVMVNKADDANFDTLYSRYLTKNANGSYPGMAIWSAGGALLSSLNANNKLWKNTYPDEDKWIEWLAKYVPEKPRISTVTLSAGATLTAGETYNGSISYTRGRGDVVVRLSCPDDPGGAFSRTEFTLAAGNGDGSVSFSFTPSLDPKVTANAVVNLSKVSGDAVLASQSLTLTVKNKDVKQTLAEYAVGHGFSAHAVASSLNEWYLSQDGVLRSASVDPGDSIELSFTAPSSGVLTVGDADSVAGTVNAVEMVDGEGTFTVLIDGDTEQPLEVRAGLRIGVTSGQRVVFTGKAASTTNPPPDIVNAQLQQASADPAKPVETVFKPGSLSFEPFKPVALSKPQNGIDIQLLDLQANHSLVDVAWPQPETEGATTNILRMGFSANDMPVRYEGDCIQTNAIDLGVVVTHTPQGTVYAAVDYVIEVGLQQLFDYSLGNVVVYGTISHFSIVAKPVFTGNPPGYVTAYQKVPVSIAFPTKSYSAVTYSAEGLPAGIAINPATGTVSGSTKKAGTYQVAIHATNASGTTTHGMTLVVKAAKNLKTKCTGLVYYADGRTLAGTIALSVAASGKATAKIVAPGKATVKGTVAVTGGGIAFGKNGLDVTRRGDGVWIGSYKGYRVVARTAGSGNTGLYTATLANNGAGRGYATATVKAKGKVRTVCKLPDAKQTSVSATGISLTAAQAADAGIYFPAGVGDTALYFPVFKRSSGLKLAGIGFVGGGQFIIPSVSWQGAYSMALSAVGIRYNASLGGFAGRTFVVSDRSGNVVASFALSASKSSVTAAGADRNVKCKATAKTGLFSASARVGKRKVNLKGALVPAYTQGAAVGKTGGSYYYGSIQ